jgi:hypothetical protein
MVQKKKVVSQFEIGGSEFAHFGRPHGRTFSQMDCDTKLRRTTCDTEGRKIALRQPVTTHAGIQHDASRNSPA